MYKVTRTVYNNALETSKMLATPYRAHSNTTLNEKYGIVIDTNNSEIPDLQYYGIGLNFKQAIASGVIDIAKARHNATDADVYYPIPFLLKNTTTPLTEAEENLYRIKVPYTDSNGNTYIACYLKKFDGTDTTNDIYKITYSQTANDYVISNLDTSGYSFLTPTIREASCDNSSDFNYVGSSQKAYCTLSNTEILQIRYAADIMYSSLPVSERYSIGELGLYSGIESVYNGKTEAAVVQAGFFKTVSAVIGAGDTFSHTVNIGGLSPLIANI